MNIGGIFVGLIFTAFAGTYLLLPLQDFLYRAKTNRGKILVVLIYLLSLIVQFSMGYLMGIKPQC